MCPTEWTGRDIDFREWNGHILILTQQKKERIGKKERLIQQLPIYRTFISYFECPEPFSQGKDKLDVITPLSATAEFLSQPWRVTAQ